MLLDHIVKSVKAVVVNHRRVQPIVIYWVDSTQRLPMLRKIPVDLRRHSLIQCTSHQVLRKINLLLHHLLQLLWVYFCLILCMTNIERPVVTRNHRFPLPVGSDQFSNFDVSCCWLSIHLFIDNLVDLFKSTLIEIRIRAAIRLYRVLILMRHIPRRDFVHIFLLMIDLFTRVLRSLLSRLLVKPRLPAKSLATLRGGAG